MDPMSTINATNATLKSAAEALQEEKRLLQQRQRQRQQNPLSLSQVTADLIYDTLYLTFWNHILFIMPAAIGQMIWVLPTPLPGEAPTIFEFVWHQIAALFVFDFQYYVWHLTHHKIRFLYRHIHAVHHRYNSPFVWVTQYLHPWELVVVGFLTTTNTWFFNSHPLTVWSYMMVSILVSVEAHIGFDFPFLLHNLDPTGTIGGSPKHDMHHQKPLTNFQPFFNHFDKLFGSYCPAMSAGGKKSKALQDYERKVKDCKKNL
ncbi:cholesterol 25-hydroxylase-like protein 1, member 2 [Aplysia californica]|uniref:Cholesterol 25-hydroxylase-like protein 1, member 2 n=1 Tax=Aplysia californica TaxID=6500 RepID=A0ABM1AAQ2_APLCA|nr:cholesterol 25-hydroxylase-like protein 1, member 2 [Aplysia californica]